MQPCQGGEPQAPQGGQNLDVSYIKMNSDSRFTVLLLDLYYETFFKYLHFVNLGFLKCKIKTSYLFYRIILRILKIVEVQFKVFCSWLAHIIIDKPVCLLNCVWLFATLWTVALQASLSMGFSGQEYWSG